MVNQITKKVMDLVNSGKSLEEALNEALNSAVTARITDRVAYIESMNTIAEVRQALHVAHAKKSKSKDNPMAVKRYEKEIETAKAKLDMFRKMIEESTDPFKKALELGEEPKTAVQYLLYQLDKEIEAKLLKKFSKLTKKQLKEKVMEQSDKTPKWIHQRLGSKELIEVYELRRSHNDLRIITLNKKANLIG